MKATAGDTHLEGEDFEMCAYASYMRRTPQLVEEGNAASIVDVTSCLKGAACAVRQLPATQCTGGREGDPASIAAVTSCLEDGDEDVRQAARSALPQLV